MKQKEKRQQVFIVHLGSLQVKRKRRALGEASIAKCDSCFKHVGSVRRNALIKNGWIHIHSVVGLIPLAV